PVVPPQAGNAAQGYVDFTLSGATAVGPNIGKTVEVSYEVTHAGATLPSDELNLSVLEIPQVNLPRPKFYADNVEVTGGTLDVTKAIKVRVLSWPLIAAGQKVWLRLLGWNSHNYDLWIAATVSASWLSTGYEEISVPVSYLNGLTHDASLSAILKVTFDQSSIEANATTFPYRIVAVQNQPTLVIDTSPMILNGKAVIVDYNWPRRGPDFPLNTSTRTPTSGTPPYTYSSSNSTIASVTAGKVTGLRNGSAAITVRDQSGQSKTYNVQVSNVKRLLVSHTSMTFTAYKSWAASMGAITLDDYLPAIVNYYKAPLPLITSGVTAYWGSESSGCQITYPELPLSFVRLNAEFISYCDRLTAVKGGFCLIDR
ncbi:Ig-like domain-containing protein, partial [Pseudomonas asplenii]|uniref:Ig-like domain-containing protein n=2 Tax=Pseudomonas asplenii TaxID=53407 RepID=UPI000288B115